MMENPYLRQNWASGYTCHPNLHHFVILIQWNMWSLYDYTSYLIGRSMPLSNLFPTSILGLLWADSFISRQSSVLRWNQQRSIGMSGTPLPSSPVVTNVSQAQLKVCNPWHHPTATRFSSVHWTVLVAVTTIIRKKISKAFLYKWIFATAVNFAVNFSRVKEFQFKSFFEFPALVALKHLWTTKSHPLCEALIEILWPKLSFYHL